MARTYTKEDRDAYKNELMSKLTAGIEELTDTDKWRDWLRCQSRFHRYSFNNAMLIVIQCPNATKVNSFKRWKELGRWVRKGEKGIKILAPCFRKYTDTDHNGDEVERQKLAGFRVVSVFDISQTDGEELPSPCDTVVGDDSGELYDRLAAYADSKGFVVTVGDADGANGWCDVMTKEIRISDKLVNGHKAKTLAHEIAHAMMHSIGDKLSGPVRELEAESVAFAVCEGLGLDSSGYTFGYLANWGGPDAADKLRESGDRIAKAAREILDAVVGE